MCVVFSVYTSTGGELTPQKVFSALSHIVFLRYVTVHFVLALVYVSDAHVGFKRIKVLQKRHLVYFYGIVTS